MQKKTMRVKQLDNTTMHGAAGRRPGIDNIAVWAESVSYGVSGGEQQILEKDSLMQPVWKKNVLHVIVTT